MYKKNLLLVLVLVLALTLTGCLSGIFGGKPTILEVTPKDVEIALDAEDRTVELTAVVKDNKGKVMKVKEADIKWVIKDIEEVKDTAENGDGEEEIELVATLSKQTGSKVIVEGKRVGEAEITVSFKKLTAKVDVVVTEIVDPKAKLIETINEAEGLKDATQIGINNGQAPVHAHAAFQTAIDDAIAIKDKEDATQEEIDGAATNLETAISMFNLEIVTKADPLKVHTLTVDGNISHFTTDSKRGTVEINNDLQYIKTGSESIKLAATGAPYPLRVRVSHPNWINDWTQYDHLAAWFYVEDVESLHKDTTIQINHPMGIERCTIKRTEFVDGWNEIVLSLRDEIGFSDEELVTMTDFFEFNIRFSSDPVPIYFDEIRLLQLEEPPILVDKEDLHSAITQAETLKAGTPVGEESGQAPEAAHTAFQTAIDAAKAVNDNADATQVQVDDAVVTLQAAIATFKAAIVPVPEPNVIFFENFEGLTDVDEFWTADYKSLPGEEKPMYFKTGGTITLEENGLKLVGGRFTIGTDRAKDATKTDADKNNREKSPGGFLDLSRSFKITVVLVDSTPGDDGKGGFGNFQLYLDNNSTSAGESIHLSDSRIYQESLAADGTIEGIVAAGGVIEVGPITMGTETSFIQVRADAGGTVVIESIKIEYVE